MDTLVLPKHTESFSTKDPTHVHEKDSEDQDYHTRKCPGDVEIPNRVFIKGFSHETTEEELKMFFEIYGIVHDAKIVRDRFAGSSKGYAFITFDSQAIAEKVKGFGNVMYKERDVVIGPAKIRKKRPLFAYSSTQSPEQYCYWQSVPPTHPNYHPSPEPVWYYQSLPLIHATSAPSPVQYQVTEQIDPEQTTQVVSCSPTWTQVSYAQIAPVSSMQQQGSYTGNHAHAQYYHQGRTVVPAAFQVATHDNNIVTNAYSINLTQATNNISKQSSLYVRVKQVADAVEYQQAPAPAQCLQYVHYETVPEEEKPAVNQPETMGPKNQLAYLEGNKVNRPTMVNRDVPSIMKRDTSVNLV